MRVLLATMSEQAVTKMASERPLSTQANLIELRKVVRRTAKRKLARAPRAGTASRTLPPEYEPRDKQMRSSATFSAVYRDAEYTTEMVDITTLVPCQRFVYVERASSLLRPIPVVGDLDDLWEFCFPNAQLPMPSILNGMFVLRVPMGAAVPLLGPIEPLPDGGYRVGMDIRPRGEFVQVKREGPNLVVIQGHNRLVALLEAGHRWVPALVRNGAWPIPNLSLFFTQAMVASDRSVRLVWFLDSTCFADIDCDELNDSILVGAQFQRTVA